MNMNDQTVLPQLALSLLLTFHRGLSLASQVFRCNAPQMCFKNSGLPANKPFLICDHSLLSRTLWFYWDITLLNISRAFYQHIDTVVFSPFTTIRKDVSI